ncbi:MAG: hypothetical protein DRI57_27400 [Deltaproteobacteria bacterium]|nr:MAG: hypothetical protein DRI57_27400 [Deltaproteobacteria bacterium]
MKYLPDSDVVNILCDNQRTAHHEAVHEKISLLADEDSLQTSVLVLYELEYSFYNAPDDKKLPIRNTIHSILRDFDAIRGTPSAVPLPNESATVLNLSPEFKQMGSERRFYHFPNFAGFRILMIEHTHQLVFRQDAEITLQHSGGVIHAGSKIIRHHLVFSPQIAHQTDPSGFQKARQILWLDPYRIFPGQPFSPVNLSGGISRRFKKI